MSEVWSKADLHIHSNHSDVLAKIPEIMEYVAHRTDLAAIAITDHNTIEGALFARSLSDMYDFEVIIGEEISSKSGHIIGLWLQEAIPPNLSAAETVSRINEQGGVAIIAHPFANRAFGPFGLESVGQAIYDVAFHALEVYNSSPYLIYANRLAARAFAGCRISTPRPCSSRVGEGHDRPRHERPCPVLLRRSHSPAGAGGYPPSRRWMDVTIIRTATTVSKWRWGRRRFAHHPAAMPRGTAAA